MKSLIIVPFMILLLGSVSNAQTVESKLGLIAYRDLSGELTPTSRVNAKSMMRIAKNNGQITIWVMLNYPYNIYLEDMTEGEIVAQEQGVQKGFAEVLDPLIARKAVWHPDSGPFIRGPGCTVTATAAGLRNLVRDQRILQIVAMD